MGGLQPGTPPGAAPADQAVSQLSPPLWQGVLSGSQGCPEGPRRSGGQKGPNGLGMAGAARLWEMKGSRCLALFVGAGVITRWPRSQPRGRLLTRAATAGGDTPPGRGTRPRRRSRTDTRGPGRYRGRVSRPRHAPAASARGAPPPRTRTRLHPHWPARFPRARGAAPGEVPRPSLGPRAVFGVRRAGDPQARREEGVGSLGHLPARRRAEAPATVTPRPSSCQRARRWRGGLGTSSGPFLGTQGQVVLRFHGTSASGTRSPE